jgi:hypothetical protein
MCCLSTEDDSLPSAQRHGVFGYPKQSARVSVGSWPVHLHREDSCHQIEGKVSSGIQNIALRFQSLFWKDAPGHKCVVHLLSEGVPSREDTFLSWHLAPVSEVLPYHFRIGRPCHFLNGKVCPPATSRARRHADGKLSSWVDEQHNSARASLIIW